MPDSLGAFTIYAPAPLGNSEAPEGIRENMDRGTYEHLSHPTQPSRKVRFALATSAAIFLPFIMLAPAARAVPLQATSPAAPAMNESLRPALDQVGLALGQVQIDRWKLSRESKAQLHGDASSIQQDLTSQLPGLFQAAQQSPAALAPQLNLMHNVDALYDVLVRISTAASLAEGKSDAATLDNAVQRLEAARKTADNQLLQAASLRDREIVDLQARMNASQTESPANVHAKTIVVDNRVTSRTRRRKSAQHRTATKPAPSTGQQPGSSTPHTAVP